MSEGGILSSHVIHLDVSFTEKLRGQSDVRFISGKHIKDFANIIA